jgi:putative phage-type endonuclease
VNPATDLKVRRSGIGGSDAAAVAGQSPWSTPMDVYLEKTGQSAPLVETDRMYWGTTLEDVVAKEWSKRTGLRVRRQRLTMRDASASWRMAHIDRAVISTDGLRHGLECKTADRMMAGEFGEQESDQVPVHYLLQCQHYLGVTGWDIWHLAVLIGGNVFRKYVIPRNDELIADLFTIEEDFWLNHVVPRIPPEIDGGEASRRFLESGLIAPTEVTPMTDRMYDLALAYENLSRQIKESGLERDLVANQIREAMGGKGRAARDNAKINWSISTVRRLDQKALVEAHPEIVAPFYVESEQPRLVITVKEAS